MHDPLTVAFDIRIPIPWKVANTIYRDKRKEWASYHLATIWHKDPEKDGSDDSCGWFKRARHGNKAVLEKIVKRFEWDWDRVFVADEGKGRRYFCGYFHPEDEGAGMPNMGVSAIALNLFFIAIGEYFESDGQSNWKKARRWMQNNLFDILMFAENPTDSLRDSITRKWGCDTKRDERIRSMASCIYAWILRRETPWYRHARWHVHHWRIQIHPLQRLWRWLFRRCCRCGKGFGWNECPIGNWSGTTVWHQRCEEHSPIKT